MSARPATALAALAEAAASSSPRQAAAILERAPVDAIVAELSELDPETASAVWRAMSPSVSRAVSAALPIEVAAAMASRGPAPRAAALLRGAGDARIDAVLGAVVAPRAEAVRRSLRYRRRAIGALVEPAPLALASGVAAGEALERIRAHPPDQRLIERVYVVGDDGALVGAAPIAALVAAPADRAVGSLASPITPAHARDDLASLERHPGWDGGRELAVVDAGGELIGVVTLETALEISGGRGPIRAGVASLSVALAELYWIGLSGIVSGLGRVPLSREGGGER